MSDEHNYCWACLDIGVRDGHYCACPVGVALRSAPRLRIGDDVYVFPPGTTMEEAQSVLDEAKRRHNEGLS